MTHWTYQWKMSFNPDITKQAQEIIFSRKKNNTSHPSLYFHNTPIQRKYVEKHLGLFLDEKKLYDLVPPFQRSSRNKGCIYEPFCRTVSFKNSFFTVCNKEVE